jgi:hypothetical protein
MAHNHKYGVTTFERGDIGPDEPVFVLRARDPLAVRAAAYYLALRASAGAPPDIAADITAAITEMEQWGQAHGTRPADT